MPIRQRDNKWYWGSKGPFNSRKKAEEVAQAAYASGYVSKSVTELVTFIEKEPLGFKNPFGGDDKKPDSLSPDSAEESVPEGNRVYIDSEQEAPKGVNVLTGKRGGLFYDMTTLTDEAQGEDITNVFNNLIDELRELETDEGVKKLNQEERMLFDIANEAKGALHATLPSGEATKNVDEELMAFIRANSEGDGEIYENPDFKKLSDKADALHEKLRDEQEKATSVRNKKMSPEAKAYNDALEEWHNSTLSKKTQLLHEKIGNSLIHSFKVNGFQVDDMKFKVDPEMKYAAWGAEYDRAAANQLRDVLEDAGKLSQDQIDELVSAAAFGEKDRLPEPIREFVDAVGESLHGQYNSVSKEFVMSPSMFKKLTKLTGRGGDISPEDKTRMLSAFGTMVHESLHSPEGFRRALVMTEYNEGRTVDDSKLLQDHLSKFFEEAPTELLSKAIVGRKYNKEFVGKNVYADKETFIDGAGGQEQHKWDGYPEMLPHVARWALGMSVGDPVKARALLGEMRDLGRATKIYAINSSEEGKRQAAKVSNYQRMNELSQSFGTYMKDYAKQYNPDPKKSNQAYASEASIVGEGLDEKYGKTFRTAKTIIPPSGPTHNDDGTLTDDAHLDVMHLVYGEKPIAF